MKDEFPLGPFVFMGITIAVCTGIGILVGADNSDLIGFGLGLVLGIVVFGVLSNLPTHTSYDEMGWRLDAAHTQLRGPQLWLQKVMQTLGMRKRW
jgi:hypothetical protein